MLQSLGWHIMSKSGSIEDESTVINFIDRVDVPAATYDFKYGITSKYHTYIFVINNLLPATDDVGLWLRVSEDNGANWKSGASDYDWTNIARSGAAGDIANDTADSEIEIVNSALGAGNAVGNASTEGFSGIVVLNGPSQAAFHKKFIYEGGWSNGSGNAGIVSGCGLYKAANAINGVRFLFESGNIASGSIRMYSLKR